ncbi:molybdopterin biosynthesis protein MoeB, partial [Mesorhizobium sp. M8A.F.Ca.ET.173.01.1.1]
EISQEMLETFLQRQDIPYQRNPYMLHFKYKAHRIVSFKGERLLIHGMTNPQQAMTLINQLFG